jgi:hypothetical protein
MKKRFSKTVLMISGILTVVVILASQSFYHPVKTSVKKTSAEQTKRDGGATITNAPADVVPSSAVQLDENTPTPVKNTPVAQEGKKAVPVAVTILSSYFKTLFRAIISPNAP